MRVVVQIIKELPKGRGAELGHGYDRYYEQSGESYYIPEGHMPLFYRECYAGWVGQKGGGVGPANYWVVASSCCHLLPEGTICRIFTNEGKEVGKL